MKYLLILSFLLSIINAAYGQKVYILDEETGQAIELVTLMSRSPKAISSTNASGEADISEFKGSEAIQIHMYGYKSKVLSYEAIKAQNFTISLAIDNFNMDEVVVSATRWRQYAHDVPSKITSISPQEVTLQNPQTAADLLNISGKVYIQKSQQGGGSPMIRGFATNRLLYTVDGVRMNTAIFRGGNIQNVINLDPFAIEDTEVLFGPGAVIYGSDAIGGVMSFQTLRPSFSLNDSSYISGSAVGRYASANKEQTGHFDVNIGWKKWALVSSISSWDYDHLRQGSNGPEDYLKAYYVQRVDSTDQIIRQDDPLLQVPTAYSQKNIMQKIRFQPSKQWDLQYGFHYSETTPYGRYDRHNRTRNDMPRYGRWDYGPQKWQMHHLSISHEGSLKLYDNLSLRVAQQYFDESRIERDFNSAEESTQQEAVAASSFNIDFSKELGKRHMLNYGGEYIFNEVNSSGFSTNINTGAINAGLSRYPASTWQTLGIYANEELQVNKNLTIQAGLRFTQFAINAQFDTTQFALPFVEANLNNSALTGSLGAVYRADENWILRANLSTGFRAPNVDDIGKIFDSEPGALTIPNPELDAEYAYNADIGMTKIFGDVLKVELIAYYTLLNNAIVRRDFQLNGADSILYGGQLSQVQALQNAAKTTVWGLQTAIELKIGAGLSFASDLNFQQGEERLADGSISAARHAVPFFGVSRLNYKAKKLRLQLYTQFQAERSNEELSIEEVNKDEIYAKDAAGNNYVPAWYTLNFKAQYSLNEHLSVNAGIENITDQRYRPYSSGLSGAGINFILSLKFSF